MIIYGHCIYYFRYIIFYPIFYSLLISVFVHIFVSSPVWAATLAMVTCIAFPRDSFLLVAPKSKCTIAHHQRHHHIQVTLQGMVFQRYFFILSLVSSYHFQVKIISTFLTHFFNKFFFFHLKGWLVRHSGMVCSLFGIYPYLFLLFSIFVKGFVIYSLQ